MKKKILTVDDSDAIRQMLVATLEYAGYQVTSAADGVEAFGIAQQQSFDMIISDLNMPKLDGIGLIKKIRKLNHLRYTPILMLTTESTEHKKLQGKKAGATGWIVKPCEPNKLTKVVKKVIR